MDTVPDEPEPVMPDLDRTPPEPVASEAEALRVVEAVLFATPVPLPVSILARQLGWEIDQVTPLLETLRGHYAGRGVALVNRGGKWCFRTAEDLAERLVVDLGDHRLSPTADPGRNRGNPRGCAVARHA